MPVRGGRRAAVCRGPGGRTGRRAGASSCPGRRQRRHRRRRTWSALASLPWAGGDEAYWRPDAPPVLAVVPPGRAVEVTFEVSAGCGGEVVFTTDGTLHAGGPTARRLTARRIGTRQAHDVLTATIPGLEAGEAVAYTYRADGGAEGGAYRPGGWVRYVVSAAPTDLDDPRFDPSRADSLLRPAGRPWPSPADWGRATIYHLMLDRFCDGDPGNNRLHYAGYARSLAEGAHGGDLVGLRSRLDYIRAMGFSAIWISPVMQNWEAYHGFEVCNFLEVDRRLGTMADLRAVADGCHERGMALILDMPLQHMAGALLRYGDDRGRFTTAGHPVSFAFGPDAAVPLPLPVFFRDTTSAEHPRRTFGRFHRYGTLGRYDDQGAPESEAELGDLFGLSDLDTERPAVRAAMIRIAQYWIAQADVDGFRLDAVKHAEADFWRTFCPAVRDFAAGLGKQRFLLFGEVLEGDPARIAPYLRGDGAAGLDGAEDYPWYFALRGVLGGGSTAALEAAEARARSSLPGARRITFLDNHDQPRVLQVLGGRRAPGPERLRVALALLLLGPGLPAVYYGTEQGFDGGRDHRNREDMFHNPEWAGDAASEGQDSFNPVHPIYRHIRRLHQLRERHPALAAGEMVPRWHDDGTRGVYVFSRLLGGEEVLVAVNAGDNPVALTAVPVAGGALRPDDVLEDALSDTQPLPQLPVGPGPALNLTLLPRSVQVWVPSPPE